MGGVTDRPDPQLRSRPLVAVTPPVQDTAREMVPSWLRRLAAIGWRVLVVSGLVVIAMALAVKLATVTASILVAFLICATFGPASDALRQRGWSKTKRAGIVTLAVIGIFVGGIVLIILAVLPAVSDLHALVDRGINQVAEWMVSVGLSTDLAATVQSLDNQFTAWLSSSALGVLGSAASIITVLMLAGFLTFYFLQDGDSAVRVATQGLPSGRRDRALDASRVAMWSAGGYLRRTALRATLRGVSMAIFLFVLGVPQAGPLAVVVFFGGLVPYLGSIFTSIIVLLAALASGGLGTALVLAVLIVAEVLFDGRIPALRVDPKGVRLHPALVIVALPTGAALAGIPGMILAVPTVAVAVALAGTVIEVLSGMPRGARVTVEGDVPLWLDRAAQWSWRLLVGAGLAAIALGLASLVPSIIAPVLVATTLAATFLPATRALEARGFSRTRAAGLISVVLWVVVGVVTIQSVAALAGPIGAALSAAAAGSDKLGDALSPGVAGVPSDTVSGVASSIREVASAVLGSVLGASIFLILTALLAFYMLKDGDHAWAAATSRLSGWRRREVDIAAHDSVTKLGGYMIATGSLGLFNAVTGYVIMVLLGLPLALPVAVLSFFGGFIPYIGQFITSAIAFLVAFAFGSTTDIVIMGIYTAVMNVVQGSVIAPLVYGRAVSLHPAVVLVAIPAGGTLGGILGMFLAVPVLGIAAGVWRHLLAAMGSEDPATRASAETATAPTTAAAPIPAPVPGPAPGT